jgi:fluoride ion exporter CrcB/FEX
MNKDIFKALPYVMVFGFLGSILRYVFTLLSSLDVHQILIIAFVNVIGSFGLGIVYQLPLKNKGLKTGIMVGLFGAFTTFSTMISQSMQLYDKSIIWSILLLLGTITFSFLSTLMAHRIMKRSESV